MEQIKDAEKQQKRQTTVMLDPENTAVLKALRHGQKSDLMNAALRLVERVGYHEAIQEMGKIIIQT